MSHPILNRRAALALGLGLFAGRARPARAERTARQQQIRWRDFGVNPEDRMAGREPGGSGKRFEPPAGSLFTTPYDNDAFIVAVETKVKCTCGCLHNVYECRSVDFSCSFWPQHHADIVEQATAGWTAREIIEQYVDTHGAEYLMAPAAQGFDLVAYLLPGTLIATAGALIALYLRRTARGAPVPAVASSASGEPPELELSENARRMLAEELEKLDA